MKNLNGEMFRCECELCSTHKLMKSNSVFGTIVSGLLGVRALPSKSCSVYRWLSFTPGSLGASVSLSIFQGLQRMQNEYNRIEEKELFQWRLKAEYFNVLIKKSDSNSIYFFINSTKSQSIELKLEKGHR